MFLKRTFLLIGIGLATLTGCSVTSVESGNTNVSLSDEKINLNVKHADLISSFTDNEKYLNKDYLYELDTLDDEDNVNIIVTLDSEGLIDLYNQNSRGYKTVGDYASGNYAKNTSRSMDNDQAELIDLLMRENYIEEVSHTYKTLFNGFSANTTY